MKLDHRLQDVSKEREVLLKAAKIFANELKVSNFFLRLKNSSHCSTVIK